MSCHHLHKLVYIFQYYNAEASVVVGATVVGTDMEKLRLLGMLAISMDMLPSVRAVDVGKEKLRLSGMLAMAADTLPSS